MDGTCKSFDVICKSCFFFSRKDGYLSESDFLGGMLAVSCNLSNGNMMGDDLSANVT